MAEQIDILFTEVRAADDLTLKRSILGLKTAISCKL
jgi:hypothetical protein